MNWSQIASKGAGNPNNFQAPPPVVYIHPMDNNNSNNNQNQQQQPFQVSRLRANPEQFKVFLRGIDAVLQQWTALNLICTTKGQQTKGGQQQQQNESSTTNQRVEFDQGPANQMREDLRSMFNEGEGEIFSDELEEYFGEFFDRERAAWIQDGSLKEVADSLHEMYRLVCSNDDSVVLRFEESLMVYQQSNTLGLCVNFGGQQNDDDDDDEDEDDDDAALRNYKYDEEGNYVAGGDDDAEYDEEYDDDDNGEYYVDEDGAPVADDRGLSKRNHMK